MPRGGKCNRLVALYVYSIPIRNITAKVLERYEDGATISSIHCYLQELLPRFGMRSAGLFIAKTTSSISFQALDNSKKRVMLQQPGARCRNV